MRIRFFVLSENLDNIYDNYLFYWRNFAKNDKIHLIKIKKIIKDNN